MKKITDKWLNENDACANAVKWTLQQKKNDINYLFNEGKKHKKYYWLNWGICKLLTKKQLIQYAIYAVNVADTAAYADAAYADAAFAVFAVNVKLKIKILNFGFKLLTES